MCLLIMKPRLGEVKSLSNSRMASMWPSWELNAGRPALFCQDEAGSQAGDGDSLLQERWFTKYPIQDSLGCG